MSSAHSLYDGEEELVFNPDSARGRYKWGGTPVPGVTTILGVLDKGPHLMQWASNCASQFWVDEGPDIGAARMLDVYDAARKEYIRLRDHAAFVGTTIHKHAENALLAGKIPDLPAEATEYLEVKAGCDAFESFMGDNSVAPIDVERVVLSRRHRYAGTCDLYGTVNGKIGLWDFKTSKRYFKGKPYMAHKLQLAAYAAALGEELCIKIDRGGIIRLDKTNSKWELYEIDLDDELKALWVQVKEMYDAVRKFERKR